MRHQTQELASNFFKHIKLSYENLEDYRQFLSKAILEDALFFYGIMPLNDFLRICILKELHKTWNNTSPKPFISIPQTLAWAYDLRLKKVKEYWFNDKELGCHRDDELYKKLNATELTAFWEAIKISRITSINWLTFHHNNDAAWEIWANGVKNAFLTSFDLSYEFSTVSQKNWKLLCNILPQSSITSLELPIDFCHSSNMKFQEFCTGLGNSKLLSLRLYSMELDKLSIAQWEQLYEAIAKSKLESLEFSWYKLYDEKNPHAWEIICNIIKLPSLKHLKWNQGKEGISDKDLHALIAAFKNSSLEKIELYQYGWLWGPAARQRMLFLLDSLKNLPLKSLYLSGNSYLKVADVLEGICDLLEHSNISTFALDIYCGTLTLESDQWKLLFNCLKNKGIDAFNMGAINLKESWFTFAQGLKGSGIRHLYLDRSQLHEMSSARWIDLANLVKEEGITDISLRGHSGGFFAHTWSHICNFIVQSHIKKIDLSYNWTFGAVMLLADAIRQSKLEWFSFNGLAYAIMDELSLDDFQIFCAALNDSKVCELIHPWIPGKHEHKLSPEKRAILQKTMKIVESRALFKKSLAELCAFSLLKADARLHQKGLEFEIDHIPIHAQLDEGHKTILRSYGIS